MTFRKAFRTFLSFYVWGFITYQVTPVEVIPYTNYAPDALSPKPVIYAYTFAYGVRTSFSNHAGSIKNLLTAMKEEGFDFVLGDFPRDVGNKLLPAPAPPADCHLIRVSDVHFLSKVFYILFERVPKLLVGGPPDSFLSRVRPDTSSECFLIVHDGRVLLTLFSGLELPPYTYILGAGKNLHFSREVLIGNSYPEDLLRSTVAVFGKEKVSVFAYSDRSFYMPGEDTGFNFRLVVETNMNNTLIVLLRNGEPKGVFDQRRLNLGVDGRGRYSVYVLKYKFKFHIFYFGVRSVAASSSISLR